MSVSAVPPGREEPIVLVVAKAPVAGRVKTRLAAVIGPEDAAALGRAMLLDTLDGCRREVPVVGVLCANDDDVEMLARLAGPDAPVVVQEGAGLSDALEAGSASLPRPRRHRAARLVGHPRRSSRSPASCRRASRRGGRRRSRPRPRRRLLADRRARASIRDSSTGSRGRLRRCSRQRSPAAAISRSTSGCSSPGATSTR